MLSRKIILVLGFRNRGTSVSTRLAVAVDHFPKHVFSTLPEPSATATATATAATPTRKLEGKVAVITGGASGIGRATASKFIANGAKVIIADINKQLGLQTATQLGSNATFIHCDVTQESNIAQAVDFAVSEHGCLDIMYNNAGIACRTPPSIIDLDLQHFDKVMLELGRQARNPQLMDGESPFYLGFFAGSEIPANR
ncbi:Tropinone reductase-like 1 [Linum grandiflorum]